MTGGDGTDGLAQIAQPPYAHCSVDLNKNWSRRQRKDKQMDGVPEGHDEREETKCKQLEQR